MNIQLRQFSLIAVVLLAISATGCINLKPSPAYASTGDLVNLGLGGIKRNSYGTAISAADLVATITSDADSIVRPVHIRNTYRAFPDYTSQYAVQTLDRDLDYFNEVLPYDGQWWVTLQLIVPNSNPAVPLPLPSGPATISVTSAALIDNQGWAQEGSQTNYSIEMMPDSVTPSMARTRLPGFTEPYQYSALRQDPTLSINPSSTAGVTEVGGLQIKLNYNQSALTVSNNSSIPHVIPRVVPLSHDPNINIIQHTVDNGDGTSSLIAMITNPNGFVDDYAVPGWSVGQSTFDDLQVAIIVTDADKLVTWVSDYWLDTAPGTNFYVDINGAVIGSMTPVLAKATP